jgi:hypothetical protein
MASISLYSNNGLVFIAESQCGTWYEQSLEVKFWLIFACKCRTTAALSGTQVAGVFFPPGFPSVFKQAIRWFPSFQVVSASFSYNFRFNTKNKPPHFTATVGEIKFPNYALYLLCNQAHALFTL